MELRSGKIYENEIDYDEEKYEMELSTNFTKWKKVINDLVYKKYSLGCEDIPDLPYFDYFVESFSTQDVFEHIEKEFFT